MISGPLSYRDFRETGFRSKSSVLFLEFFSWICFIYATRIYHVCCLWNWYPGPIVQEKWFCLPTWSDFNIIDLSTENVVKCSGIPPLPLVSPQHFITFSQTATIVFKTQQKQGDCFLFLKNNMTAKNNDNFNKFRGDTKHTFVEGVNHLKSSRVLFTWEQYSLLIYHLYVTELEYRYILYIKSLACGLETRRSTSHVTGTCSMRKRNTTDLYFYRVWKCARYLLSIPVSDKYS